MSALADGDIVSGSTKLQKRRKERMWQQRDPFSSFERSDIWNKELSYVNSPLWFRQTDRGQVLPARQVNRPHRVGSLRDDSLTHRETGTRTHTQSVHCFNLKRITSVGLLLQNTLDENGQISESVAFFFVATFLPAATFICSRRWKSSWWDCLSRRLSHVTDS